MKKRSKRNSSDIQGSEKKPGFFRKFGQFIKGKNKEKEIPWGFIFLACAVIWAVVELVRSILFFFN